jgi:small multidrug resistance pump
VKELPLAVVYATWSGLGIALVTVLGIFLYRQNLPWQGFAGLVLIIIGVTLLNAYLPKTT